MKKTIYYYTKLVGGSKYLLALCLMFSFYACQEESGVFEVADGVPSIRYVRVPDENLSDSLLTGAFLGNSIAIIGENLNSVSEIWFNDKKAVLNTSFITNNAIIVSVPREIPEDITDKIYFVNKSKADTVAFDFNIQVPAPVVASMKCEYVEVGEEAVFRGNYFLPVAGAETPEVIFTPNIVATEIIAHAQGEITVVVPQGAVEGPVSVRSRYGTTRSDFHFRDTRGMILDWDNLDAAGGWRSGVVSDVNPVGISGKYVRFQGNLSGEVGDWNEDAFSFNLWGQANGRPQGNLFSSAPETSVLKFEINVLEAWSASALQMIFTPWSTGNTNGYIADGVTPRALWRPWETSGSYTTDGWETISIPLRDFKFSHTGGTLQVPPANGYGGLTFFVFHGGVAGRASSPHILIDNIRVVPE